MAGAVVMGTGELSTALSLDGREGSSRVLLVLAAALWVGLAILLGVGFARDRQRVMRGARSTASLTAVAGTSVLGVRVALLGWSWVPAVLLCLAMAAWLVLIGPVLSHLETPTVGASLLLTVSTESLAVLAALLATDGQRAWQLDLGFAAFLLGLGLYLFTMARFDWRELLRGRGDHWITGGALAIATLAAAHLAIGAREVGGPDGLMRGVSLGLWVVALSWLAVLIAAEVLRPRLRYEIHRWSTVFPVCMYASSSFLVGKATGDAAPTDFARVWVWAGVGLWIAVVAATPVSAYGRHRRVRLGRHSRSTGGPQCREAIESTSRSSFSRSRSS
jgi:tellurite resistance protein TehA-like permease